MGRHQYILSSTAIKKNLRCTWDTLIDAVEHQKKREKELASYSGNAEQEPGSEPVQPPTRLLLCPSVRPHYKRKRGSHLCRASRSGLNHACYNSCRDRCRQVILCRDSVMEHNNRSNSPSGNHRPAAQFKWLTPIYNLYLKTTLLAVWLESTETLASRQVLPVKVIRE